MRKVSTMGSRVSVLSACAIGMTSILAATPTQKSITSLRTSPTPNNYITSEANYYTPDSNQDYPQYSGGGGQSVRRNNRRQNTVQPPAESVQQYTYPTQVSSSGSSQGGLRGFFSNIFHWNDNSQAYPQTPSMRQSRYNGYTQSGRASWYGSDAHGGPTASGERFDMNEMTAAHRSLPFNTVVKVTNLRNGTECLVRINDRGPFVEGRILDLSKTAARQLGMIGSGTANVQMTVLGVAN